MTRWPSWDAFAQSCYETGAMAREMDMVPEPIVLEHSDWFYLLAQGLSDRDNWLSNSERLRQASWSGEFDCFGVKVKKKP